MGLYFPARTERFTNSIAREPFNVGPGLTLESVSIDWTSTLHPDIFVSHQHNDLQRAKHAAEVLQAAGISAYVDRYDPHVTTDGPNLESYLSPNPPMGGVKARQVGMREPTREKAWAPWGPM